VGTFERVWKTSGVGRCASPEDCDACGRRAGRYRPARLTPSRLRVVAVALKPGCRPALLAWAADLTLGQPPADAFTRSRVFRRRHRATRACASASVARDRRSLPNQSDPRRHYGQNPGDLTWSVRSPCHDRPDRRRAADLVMFGRVTSCRSGASREVCRPLQHMPAATRCPSPPRERTIPLRRFAGRAARAVLADPSAAASPVRFYA
jgi:hypothetical protein